MTPARAAIARPGSSTISGAREAVSGARVVESFVDDVSEAGQIQLGISRHVGDPMATAEIEFGEDDSMRASYVVHLCDHRLDRGGRKSSGSVIWERDGNAGR